MLNISYHAERCTLVMGCFSLVWFVIYLTTFWHQDPILIQRVYQLWMLTVMHDNKHSGTDTIFHILFTCIMNPCLSSISGGGAKYYVLHGASSRNASSPLEPGIHFCSPHWNTGTEGGEGERLLASDRVPAKYSNLYLLWLCHCLVCLNILYYTVVYNIYTVRLRLQS